VSSLLGPLQETASSYVRYTLVFLNVRTINIKALHAGFVILASSSSCIPGRTRLSRAQNVSQRMSPPQFVRKWSSCPPAAKVIISEHAEVIVDTSVIILCFIRNEADERLVRTSSHTF